MNTWGSLCCRWRGSSWDEIQLVLSPLFLSWLNLRGQRTVVCPLKVSVDVHCDPVSLYENIHSQGPWCLLAQPFCPSAGMILGTDASSEIIATSSPPWCTLSCVLASSTEDGGPTASLSPPFLPPHFFFTRSVIYFSVSGGKACEWNFNDFGKDEKYCNYLLVMKKYNSLYLEFIEEAWPRGKSPALSVRKTGLFPELPGTGTQDQLFPTVPLRDLICEIDEL